ncbi:MAG TPA: ExeM/NucH family extracellular endonuclease [Candidatus Limnocylindrales bacterium]|nr:ExeM/NucH family extracellular endonuclease [Candidatus Limnocylindrales bacterium]
MARAVSRSFRSLGAFGGAVLILGGLLPAALASPVAAAVGIGINEFSASTVGTDVEYVEVLGPGLTDLSAYKLLQIEGDASTSGSPIGTIDSVISLGTPDADGRYLVSLSANTLENGTITLLLVDSFTGAVGNDLDTNEDGTLESTPWGSILDGVAVNDGGAGDRTYAVTLGVAYDGQSFAPGGASRIPDGTDTDTTADWVRNDFDLAGIPGFSGTPLIGEALNTPGAANSLVKPGLSIGDVSIAEGDSGTTTFTFTVSLSVAASGPVTFDIATADDTATSPSDYTAKALTRQSIAAGRTSATFDVLVNGDSTAEPDEAFLVNLTNVSGADVTDAQARGTIVNDDAAITPIHDIQTDDGSSTAGTFSIQGIVVGDYQDQGSGRLRGFFVQEEDADVDADAATSEGIFVFCSTCPTPVSVGDAVRVTGPSSEFFGMTQLTASGATNVTVLSTGNPLPTPASLELPVPGIDADDLASATAAINAYFERSEGMLVTFPATLSVSEYFELARYGQVILSAGGRPHTFTALHEPSEDGFEANEVDLARRTIILDDTDNRENRPSDSPNTPYFHPVPGLSTTNYFRGGDTITDLTGVLHWSFAGGPSPDAWRIRPVTEAFDYTFTPVNDRPEVPDVDGRLRVASFNVLNYFLSLDTANSCAPTQNQDCRGADSQEELDRQRTKLLAALSAIDADVFGFMEMENTPGVEPLADLVAGLDGYEYVDTGVIGTDAIRVGLIYRPGTVTPVGDHAVLDTQAFVNPRNAEVDRNRPAVAQTFEENATGARFTVVVNHLKSKGSGCGAGDDDTTTGQGNCTLTRTLAAQELAEWLATDPTGSGDTDVLIIGDLNSYAKEDPIKALRDAGYTDLVRQFGGDDAYGYVFDGQLGYLDHALANESLAGQVAGVGEWHINADEIPLLDYNDDVRTADEAAFEEESDSLPLYAPDAFRTSDHDPILIGLNLTIAPEITSLTLPATPVARGASASLTATFTDGNADDTHVASIDWGDGIVQTVDPATSPIGPRTHAYTSAGLYTVSLTVTDSSGLADTATARVVVYDPLGGFVTGGGSIISPAGALAASPTRSGPASFDFSAKLGKNTYVPKGTLAFSFPAGGFTLTATAYDWLIVTGRKAVTQGSGMVGGTGSYRFILSVVDGAIAGGSARDTFRLKVWDPATGDVVYDNQPGAADDATATQRTASGQIVVHP